MYFRVCGCYVLLFFCFSLGVIAFRAFAFLPEKIKKHQYCTRLFRGMLEIVEPTLQLSCAILHVDDTY